MIPFLERLPDELFLKIAEFASSRKTAEYEDYWSLYTRGGMFIRDEGVACLKHRVVRDYDIWCHDCVCLDWCRTVHDTCFMCEDEKREERRLADLREEIRRAEEDADECEAEWLMKQGPFADQKFSSRRFKGKAR